MQRFLLLAAALLALGLGPAACWFNDSSGGSSASWRRHEVADAGVTASLNGVWGAAANDVWAVGDEGTLLHFDGSAWSRVESPLEEQLNDVWGTGPDDVWAVGGLAEDDGFILHYDGSTWSVDYPRAGQTIIAVWGSAPDNVYAVGGADKPTLIMHFDGNLWREEGLPLGVDFGQDVWVGEDGEAFVAAFGDVARFSGDEWKVIAEDFEADHPAYAIWGAGPDNVFVAGSSSVIRHFDGTTWSDSVAFNVNEGYEVEIRGLFGVSAKRVFAVGHVLGTTDDKPPATHVAASRVYSFDGSNWYKHDLGKLAVELNAVWGMENGDIWAVGEGGTILSY